MQQLQEARIDSVLRFCRENAQAVAEALGRCLGGSYRIEPGETGDWDSVTFPAEFHRAGLALAVEVGSWGMICLLPATLPLPEWYADPDADQERRLLELAQGWSRAVLPREFQAGPVLAIAVADLLREAADARPFEQSAVLELRVHDAADANVPAVPLYLVWPVRNPPFPVADDVAEGWSLSPPAAAKVGPSADRARRLLRLPVTISVRLAEKKIEFGQLLALAPGSLITFNKSCEDLLDLYVNNHRYGRGEAVKIGEKFGLKVNEIGTVEQRERRVFHG